MLTELGLICEVHSGDNGRRYIIRRQAVHHHHLICSGCGSVVDFTDCDLSELGKRLSHETGFEMEGHLLEFYGRCQRCQTENS
jgi:Fur family ferric uptake transcriptional regulator